MITFYRTEILALLYVFTAIYFVILRSPLVVTAFDMMLLLILVLDHKNLYFKSKIPTDKNLLLYLGSMLILLVYHQDLNASLKEIIQIIEIYLFYVVIVSYFADFSDLNSKKYLKFFSSFFYLILFGLVISIFIGALTRERSLLHFLAVPLLIISVLSLFYEKKVSIKFLRSNIQCLFIASFSLAIMFYENSRTAILFFIFFILLLALNLKKRYLIPLIALSFIAFSVLTFFVANKSTELYRYASYDASGSLSYKDTVGIGATRGLSSVVLIFENLEPVIAFITTPDKNSMDEKRIIGSNYERLFQLKFVYQSFLDSPFFGLGPNQAAERSNVHGIFFVTLVDYGLFGLLVLVSYFLSSYLKARKLKANNNIFDLFLYYYLVFSFFVLTFISAGIFPMLPFIFASALIYIRDYSNNQNIIRE
jgi:hypothetical protein